MLSNVDMLSIWKLSIRNLLRQPGFTLAVVLTLALGIGANSAIFSVIDAVLLKPLPYPQADRLMALSEATIARKSDSVAVSPALVEDWQRMNHVFNGVAGGYTESLSETSGPFPEKVVCARVSPRFFSVLGMLPLEGRGFVDSESALHGPAVAVIRESLARRRFAVNESAVGKTIRVGATTYSIVGVVPDRTAFPSAETEIWTPAQFPAAVMQQRRAHFYSAIGRLKDGATPEAALADLSTLQAQLAAQFPAEEKVWIPIVEPLKEAEVGEVRRSLWIVFAAVSLLLLIACGNVACLFLVRSQKRQRELAIRFSLGATRWQVLRDLLAEGLILAAAGSLCGFLLMAWTAGALRTVATNLPRASEIHVDWRLAVFAFSLTILTTLLFALAPGLAVTRRGAAETMASGSRTQVGGRQRGQRLLVAGQIALTIVLLIGAGLLLRSFTRMMRISPGFQADHVLVFRVSAGWGETNNMPAVHERIMRTIARIKAIPGVEAVATAGAIPGTLNTNRTEFVIPGQDPDDTAARLRAYAKLASGEYVAVLRIPLLSGEGCPADADPLAANRVVISQQFAQRAFPNQQAVGRTVMNVGADARALVIAGVTADTFEAGLGRAPEPVLYLCGVAGFLPDPKFLARVKGDPNGYVSALREAIREVSPTRALYDAGPLTDRIADDYSDARFYTILLSLFAGTALLLAAVGLYGLMTYFVAQSTREIGLRMALGAQASRILRDVMVHGSAITISGVIAGLVLAGMLTRLLSSLLVGISPRDLMTFVAVPLVLALVTGLAAYLPARRASRVDPMVALRQE